MPPWLKALLLANNSMGLADTLTQLYGQPVQFEKMVSSKSGATGKVLGPGRLGLTDIFAKDFTRPGMTRKGPNTADSSQKFGDYVLGHEFGHLNLRGDNDLSIQISEALEGDVPTTNEENEELADSFQSAIQFLRGHKTEANRLSPKSLKIMEALLKQEIYKDHPINKKRKAFAALDSLNHETKP